MGDREEFDRIVEGLDWDLSALDEEPSATEEPPEATRHPSNQPPVPEESPADDSRSPDVDEQFYRRVDPPAPHGWKRGTTAAWVGVVGSPSSLVVLTVLGFTAPRALVVALSLVFVASAIYLIAQLPEHGPSRGDDPDDGAVL
jgi:hypothetical protein